MDSVALVVASGYDTPVIAAGGLPIVEKGARFSAVQRSLAQAGVTIGVRYARIVAHDTSSTLIDRADADGLATPRRIPGSASERMAARP